MLDIKQLREEYRSLPQNKDASVIKETADDLKGFNYSPDILFEIKDFLFFTRENMLNELNRVIDISNEQMFEMGFEDKSKYKELKINHLNMLLHHYKLLCRLRDDETEAWDEINELYEDD